MLQNHQKLVVSVHEWLFSLPAVQIQFYLNYSVKKKLRKEEHTENTWDLNVGKKTTTTLYCVRNERVLHHWLEMIIYRGLNSKKPWREKKKTKNPKRKKRYSVDTAAQEYSVVCMASMWFYACLMTSGTPHQTSRGERYYRQHNILPFSTPFHVCHMCSGWTCLDL